MKDLVKVNRLKRPEFSRRVTSVEDNTLLRLKVTHGSFGVNQRIKSPVNAPWLPIGSQKPLTRSQLIAEVERHAEVIKGQQRSKCLEMPYDIKFGHRKF